MNAHSNMGKSSQMLSARLADTERAPKSEKSVLERWTHPEASTIGNIVSNSASAAAHPGDSEEASVHAGSTARIDGNVQNLPCRVQRKHANA